MRHHINVTIHFQVTLIVVGIVLVYAVIWQEKNTAFVERFGWFP